MKRTVRVVKEFEYNIELDDSILTQEFVNDFERGFWELEADSLEGKLEKLFEVAAYQIANGEENFVEGLGYCTSKGMSSYYKETYPEKKFSVVYDENYSETETEML